MSAKDRVHNAVRRALEKDGWTITHDPLRLSLEDADFQIDLGAEKLIAAEKDSRKIAVEVKSFLAPSAVFEMHRVVGQYLIYEQALEETEPERKLFLAVPYPVYEVFFARRFVQSVIRRRQLRVIVVSTDGEEIVEWKS